MRSFCHTPLNLYLLCRLILLCASMLKSQCSWFCLLLPVLSLAFFLHLLSPHLWSFLVAPCVVSFPLSSRLHSLHNSPCHCFFNTQNWLDDLSLFSSLQNLRWARESPRLVARFFFLFFSPSCFPFPLPWFLPSRIRKPLRHAACFLSRPGGAAHTQRLSPSLLFLPHPCQL